MYSVFFEISSASHGEAIEISEQRFDARIEQRSAFDLFAAVKGDLVWACGGPALEAEREASRSQRLFRSNVMPIINLARAGQWLTPSQASLMTAPTAIPRATIDPSTVLTYRKALEKGRRAVDLCLEKRGKLGVWRAIETGQAAANGERTFRFRKLAKDSDGQPLDYCLVWMEHTVDGVDFHPQSASTAGLPLHDGSFQVAQARQNGLKATVRDVVLNGHSDEAVFLVDLHNERRASRGDKGRLSLINATYRVRNHSWLAESPLKGARIRSQSHDIQRLPNGRARGPVATLEPGRTLHYVCLTFPLEGWEDLDPGPLATIELELHTQDRHPLSMSLPFRVVGEPLDGRLVREGDGWAWRPNGSALGSP